MGWVNVRRDHGGVIFVDLRDRSGLVQLVFNPEHSPSAHAVAGDIRGEFVVRGVELKTSYARELPPVLADGIQLQQLVLNLVVNGLRAGFSVMQALEAVGKELPPPISTEFKRVVQEMQLGLPMEQALGNLTRRIDERRQAALKLNYGRAVSDSSGQLPLDVALIQVTPPHACLLHEPQAELAALFERYVGARLAGPAAGAPRRSRRTRARRPRAS